MLKRWIPLLALIGCTDKGIDTSTESAAVPTPDISVNTNILDFGDVSLDARSALEFNVSNMGTANLTVTSIELHQPYVSVLPTPFVIVPSNVITLTILCEPTDTSQFSYPDALILSSDDPDEPEVTIDLRCRLWSDVDGDGYSAVEAGGDDCDDHEPDTHPGAEDAWYDGIDDNCDGADDYDQDSDGYQTDVYNPDPDDGGGDCQDANSEMHPGAEDTDGDGIDADCDGADG